MTTNRSRMATEAWCEFWLWLATCAPVARFASLVLRTEEGRRRLQHMTATDTCDDVRASSSALPRTQRKTSQHSPSSLRGITSHSESPGQRERNEGLTWHGRKECWAASSPQGNFHFHNFWWLHSLCLQERPVLRTGSSPQKSLRSYTL